MITKRQDEAMEQMERALELDRFNPMVGSFNGMLVPHGAHRFDDAIEQFRSVLNTVPNHPLALGGLVDAFYAREMYEEAFELAKSNWADRGNREAVETLERGYAEDGFRGAMSRLAEWKAARWGICEPFNYIAAGKNQQALDCLEQLFATHSPSLPYIGVLQSHASLRKEPRFQDLLRRMNFPEEVLTAYLDEVP